MMTNLEKELVTALWVVLDSGLLHGPTTLHAKTLSVVHAAISKAQARK
jgi:hypothetical protein